MKFIKVRQNPVLLERGYLFRIAVEKAHKEGARSVLMQIPPDMGFRLQVWWLAFLVTVRFKHSFTYSYHSQENYLYRPSYDLFLDHSGFQLTPSAANPISRNVNAIEVESASLLRAKANALVIQTLPGCQNIVTIATLLLKAIKLAKSWCECCGLP